MKLNFFKIAVFILSIVFLLSGCGYGSVPSTDVDSNTDDTNSDSATYDGFTSITSQDGELTNPEDNDFTLCWLKSDSLNPFGNMTGENAAVSSLMYEGLFTVDPDFNAVPCLCSGYSVDGLTYTFNIKKNITFHDGSLLSADDAVYSITRAMYSERFSSRLKCIEDVSSVDEYTVQITVKAENYTLPALLDIPIVQSGTAGDTVPVGTGPYIYNRGTDVVEPYLSAYLGYRDSVPVSKIHLYDISHIEPDVAMSQRKVDFILHSPLEETLDVYTDHSTIYYNTTALQFVGFDTGSYLLSDSEVRRAISHLVNRELIVSEVFNNNAVSAPLALSPYAPGYDNMPESISDYSTQTFSAILSAKGAEDTDGDGWLELDGSTISLTFIVSDSDDYKVQAARSITSSLNSIGIKVNLKVLSSSEYLYALNTGNFDMYYAEIRLPANFDLSELLGSSGSANFGSYTAYDEVLASYLAAKTDEQKAAAARELCRLIYEKSPIIPICYNKNAVAVPRSTVRGVQPGQQYLFWNLFQWTINFEQED